MVVLRVEIYNVAFLCNCGIDTNSHHEQQLSLTTNSSSIVELPGLFSAKEIFLSPPDVLSACLHVVVVLLAVTGP